MVANLDAYKSGQVAMQMNWFAFFPGIAKDEDVGGDKSGFFVNPAQKVEASTLGGQGISVVAYSDKQDWRSSTSSGSPIRRSRRSGGRWAATPATWRCWRIPTSPTRRPSPPTS